MKDYIKAHGAELAHPPMPVVPNFSEKTSVGSRLRQLQDLISSLQYNYTGANYFNLRKTRPLHQIIATGREIVREALPIRCLEAVFLAIFLTQGGAWVNLVDRFPVSFKSSVGGQTYRHIILATRVKATGLFGALGLSRRSSLMWKPPTFTSFALLIQDYQKVRQRLPPSPKLIGLSPQCPAGTCG